MARYRSSRLSRKEEKKLQKRIKYATISSIAIILFLIFFGFRLIVAFSVLVGDLQGGSENQQDQTNTFLLPPTLDPMDEATKSAYLDISGYGKQGSKVLLFLNGEQVEETTIDEEGKFLIPSVQALGGDNTIYALIETEDGTRSDKSNQIDISVITRPPALAVDTPEDGAQYYGEDDQAEVTGQTEENVSVTINGRFVRVDEDGSFRMTVSLDEGDNELIVVAEDKAGNQAKSTRTVKYEE